MKSAAVIFFVLALSCFNAHAAEPPSFEQFPVKVDSEKLRSVDTSKGKKAGLFRSAAKAAIGRESDFAGHYVVVSQGCGANCHAVAFIDVRTGIVYPAGIAVSLGKAHRADSRLFIDSPPKDVLDFYGGSLPPAQERIFFSSYYQWDESGKRLRLIFTGAPSSK